jgi:hypothetical protein
MSIIFKDLEPALEQELAEEADVSQEVARKLVAVLRQVLVSSARGPDATADIVIEDVSGHVVLLDLKFGSGEAERLATDIVGQGAARAILGGAVAAALTTAMKDWERQTGSYREVLAALVPKDRGPVAAAALLQARRNAIAQERLLDGAMSAKSSRSGLGTSSFTQRSSSTATVDPLTWWPECWRSSMLGTYRTGRSRFGLRARTAG